MGREAMEWIHIAQERIHERIFGICKDREFLNEFYKTPNFDFIGFVTISAVFRIQYKCS